ncbi:MAG: SH3 domain-containing protein [Lachnospiraceae bacterium]|nr:SH3 domain-containing protein [Lachnospiraceae bacterium]
MKNLKRYILAALCGLGIVLMLGFGINAMDVKADPFVSVKRNYTNESRNTSLKGLIQAYYDAYDEGNLLALNKVAYPFSDSEISYIELMSKKIDSRSIREIYSKKGIDKGTYFVSVVNDINFAGMDKSAPGLDFFYVETDEDGNLYINNLYSTYNLNNSENPTDPYITSIITEFEQQGDVLQLQAKVQAEFNDTMEKNPDLSTFFNETLQSEVSEWATAYHQKTLDKKAEEEQKAKAEAEAQKAAEEAAKAEAEAKAKAEAEAQAAADKAAQEAAAQQAAAQQAAAQQAAAQQAASTGTLVNSKTINVRAAADASSQNIGRLECGTVISKKRDEGEWTVIDYNGRDGFIKTEFVTSISNSTPRDVTLTKTVNVRDEMSENGQKVAVAQMGTAVKIECDYANGWSRVSFGTTKGFAKTEYIG